ncbi:unnamed protein product, partial [Ilex paraguariensis]
MGRWRASPLLLRFASISKCINPNPNGFRPIKPIHLSLALIPRTRFCSFRAFSALPSPSPIYDNEFDLSANDFVQSSVLDSEEEEESGKIPVKAFFLCTSIDLKSMQAENSSNVLPVSRSSNYIALRFFNFPSETT